MPLARSGSATKDPHFRRSSPKGAPVASGLLKETTKGFSLECTAVGNLAGGLCQFSYSEALNLASESGPESNWNVAVEGGVGLQVSKGSLKRSQPQGPHPVPRYNPNSNPESFPLLTEWRWHRATHEGGDSGGLEAEGSSEPGRQP